MKKVFFIFLLLTFAFSCQQSSTKKALKICINTDPPTLDARKSGDLVSSALLFMLFSGLTEFREDGAIHPSLAESYTISEDKKTYTFSIRKNALWSDGKKITAHDFEASWKKVIDPRFPSLCPQLFYPILNAEQAAKGEISVDAVGIHAKDAKTLIVTLKNPCPYFLSLTSFCIYFPVPSHVKDISSWENDPASFVCSGPFILKKWVHNNELIVEKNHHFWNSKNVALSQIHISIIKDPYTALQMFERGEIDWLGTLLSPLPLDLIPNVIQKKEHTLTPINGTTFCAFNTEKFPFHNKNIRKAFGLSINRQAIVENITQAKELIATRAIPPALMQNKNLVLYQDNQKEEAQQLFQQGLQELNITEKDISIIFSYGPNPLHKKQAEALQETWAKMFNISIKLEQLEEKVIIDRLHRHQFQLALTYWIAQYNDAMNILDRFKYKKHSKNYPHWENENYIQLLDQSTQASSLQERLQILEQAEKIFIEEMPISPIYHHNYITLTNPNVTGIFIGPVGGVHFDNVRFLSPSNH